MRLAFGLPATLLAVVLLLLLPYSRAQQPSTAEQLIRQEQLRQAVEDAFELYRAPAESGDVKNDNLVEAVGRLEQLGDEAVAFLVSELEQAQPDTFFFAAYALGRVGTAAAGAALREAVAQAQSQPGDWAQVRQAWGCFALGLMGQADAITLANEGRHYAGHVAIHGNFTVLESIALQTAPDSVPLLLEQLAQLNDENDPRFSERIVVLKALGLVRHASSSSVLDEMLREAHPILRRQAAYALGKFDTDAAVSALLTALGDPDVRARRGAAIALKDSLPVGRLEIPVAQLESEEEPIIRGALYEVIARAGGAAMTDVLVSQWGRSAAQDRAQLVRVLPGLDPDKVLPLVREAAQDPEPQVFVAATIALAEIGSDAAMDVLIELVRSPYWSLAQSAVEQVAALAESRAAPALWQRLVEVELAGVVKDPQQRLRAEKLCDALLTLQDTQRLDELRVAAARQKDGLLVRYLERRLKQFDAIAANGNKAKRWIAAIESSQSDPDVRLVAYAALGRLGGERAARALAETFGRVEPEEGIAILRALGAIDSPSSRQLIERVLTAPEFDPIERSALRDMAAWSARRLGGAQMYATLLAAVERRSGRDTRPLIYLAVLGQDQAIPVLDRYRAERMRYIKWSRGAELDKLDWIRRELAHGRPIDAVDLPPGELRF